MAGALPAAKGARHLPTGKCCALFLLLPLSVALKILTDLGLKASAALGSSRKRAKVDIQRLDVTWTLNFTHGSLVYYRFP